MGYYFQAIDTNQFIDKYSLLNYVETGTGEGATLEFAMRHPFDNFYSIEIHDKIYESAKRKFNKLSQIYRRECLILHGNSYEQLPSVLEKLDGNTFFFLDAHFPGADFKFSNYGDTKDYDIRLPLEKEIDAIIKNRDISGDVFVIDDLVIFEPDGGPYEAGPLTLDREICPKNGLEFIYNIFSETHDIKRSYKSQGFLIITPKQRNKKFVLKNDDGIPTWLESFYNKHLPDTGLFVEVGVGHTIDGHWSSEDTKDTIKAQKEIFKRCGSNTLDLLEYGYSGIYIDPIKEFCDELALITKDKNIQILNLGCSNKVETIPLYLGETFKQNSQIGDPRMGYTVDYVGREVKCDTLSSILNNLSIDEQIDLMSIDVEGWELKVLEGIEDKHLPKLMIIEINKSAGVHEELEKRGYVLCYRDARDAGYVRGDIA